MEDVVILIKIRVIKLKKHIILFTVALLVLSLFVTFFRENMKIVPAFGQIQTPMHDEFIQKIDDSLFKKLLCWSLPALDSFKPKEKPVLKFSAFTSKVSQLITNVDIYDLESYFGLPVPLMSLMKVEATLTPGVEYIENDIDIKTNDDISSQENEPDIEKITSIQGKPLVLIYHTHTTESYTPSKKFNYELTDQSYHTEDLNYTVVKVGEVLTEELNKLGIPTLHNKTVHDIPTYMTSYSNSLKTAKQVLEENPSIKIVIDLHRDAPFTESEKSRELTTVKIDGKTYSRILFVIGSDKVFTHPKWKENHKFALLLSDKIEEIYPGISRGIDLRENRFNQHLANKAILLEIGSHGNTMDESIETAKLFAESLAEVVKDLSM